MISSTTIVNTNSIGSIDPNLRVMMTPNEFKVLEELTGNLMINDSFIKELREKFDKLAELSINLNALAESGIISALYDWAMLWTKGENIIK